VGLGWGGLLASSWVLVTQERLTVHLDLLGGRSWTNLESLALPLTRQVGWCCGWAVRQYVSLDVFVIYIHFVCCLVCCLFLSFGKGVIPSIPLHSLWLGEFCPSMSDIVCYGESSRGGERERNNHRVEFFYVICLGHEIVVNRVYELCV
jgi:hypothetical protein